MEIISKHATGFARFAAGSFALAMFGLTYALSDSYLAAILAIPLTAWLGHRFMMRRYYRRQRTIATQFPAEWRAFLGENVPFYRNLAEAERIRFEQLIQVFLSEQTISGVDPVVVDDSIRLMVAAGAITLVFHRPEWDYDNLREILIYQDAFDLDNYLVSRHKPILGAVGSQMPLILSLRHLTAGFRHPGDGFNLAYHEFAHIIDLHDVGSNTNPLHGLFAGALIRKEIKKIERGESILHDYAATNESEFFAVATEFFYEQPHVMREHHPELYATLSRLYNHDPAKQSLPADDADDPDAAGYWMNHTGIPE